MYHFAFTQGLFLFAVATTSAIALQARQSCSGNLALPQRCSNAYSEYSSELTRILSPHSNPIDRQNLLRQAITEHLDTVCSRECLNAINRLFQCSNSIQQYNFTVTGVCGRAPDGMYCPVKLLDISASQPTLPAPTCARQFATCSADCRSRVNSLKTEFGCCTAAWYSTVDGQFAPFSGYSNQFTRCGVDIGPFCSGAGIQYVSITLLFTATFVTAILH